MKITKIISIFIIITLFYVGTNYIINQPPSSMAYEIRMSAYWVNFGISLPLKLINLIIPKEYTSESPMLMFLVPFLWTLLILPWSFRRTEDSLLSQLDSGFVSSEKNISFLPHTLKQKIANSLGLKVLTEAEDLIIYRMSVVLPMEYRQILKKQLKKINRVQRIFGDEKKVIMITTFESRKFYLFRKNPIYPKLNIKDYEAILASCVVAASNGYIAVDLVISQGIISRIQFQSDKSINMLKGPFIVQDVRLNSKIVD